MNADTSRISPTAHYTGFVWYRNGLADPVLKTHLGWALYHAAQPLMRASRALGGPGVEDVLLARHAILDHLLGSAIERAGTAVVTEGLVNYFDRASVMAMWARIRDVLAGFARGLYVSDLHLEEHVASIRGARVFRSLVSMLARGRVHLHFARAAGAERALLDAGFARARVRPPGAFAHALALPPRRCAAPVAIITAETRPRSR